VARHFLSILDLTPAELRETIDLATRIKRERALGSSATTAQALAGRHVGLLFEKPSLRTRVTFTIGVPT
jgi:ornithine carbamoyltransferase